MHSGGSSARNRMIWRENHSAGSALTPPGGDARIQWTILPQSGIFDLLGFNNFPKNAKCSMLDLIQWKQLCKKQISFYFISYSFMKVAICDLWWSKLIKWNWCFNIPIMQIVTEFLLLWIIQIVCFLSNSTEMNGSIKYMWIKLNGFQSNVWKLIILSEVDTSFRFEFQVT